MARSPVGKIRSGEALPDFLIRTRLLKGQSQERAATEMGVNVNSIANWEQGLGPKIERAPMIAAWSGVSVDRIVKMIFDHHISKQLERAERAVTAARHGRKSASPVEKARRRTVDQAEREQQRRAAAQVRYLEKLPERADLGVLASEEIWR